MKMFVRVWMVARAKRVPDEGAGVGFEFWWVQLLRRREQRAQGVGYEGSGIVGLVLRADD